MLFQLRVAPSGEVVEGTDGQFLQYDLTERKWRTVDLSTVLRGQVRFLVGSAASGANYQDIDAAIVDAAAAAVATGARQTVFLVGGETFAPAANPLVLPDSVDLVGLGQRSTITTAIQASPAAGTEQTIENVRVEGAAPAIGFTSGIVAADLPLAARLLLRDCEAASPANNNSVAIAVVQANGGTLAVEGGTYESETFSPGAVVFDCDTAMVANVFMRNVALDNGGIIGVQDGGAICIRGTGDASLDFDVANCELFSSADGIRVENTVGQLDATGTFVGCTLIAPLGLDPAAFHFLNATSAGNIPLTWCGGQILAARLQVLEAQGLLVEGTSITITNAIGSAFGGTNTESARYSGCDVSLQSAPNTIGDTVTFQNCHLETDDPAGDLFEVAAAGDLTLVGNEIDVNPALTLIADGTGTVRSSGNAIVRGNAAWVSPATAYAGTLTTPAVASL